MFSKLSFMKYSCTYVTHIYNAIAKDSPRPVFLPQAAHPCSRLLVFTFIFFQVTWVWGLILCFPTWEGRWSLAPVTYTPPFITEVLSRFFIMSKNDTCTNFVFLESVALSLCLPPTHCHQVCSWKMCVLRCPEHLAFSLTTHLRLRSSPFTLRSGVLGWFYFFTPCFLSSL